jgi:hypothetical protein
MRDRPVRGKLGVRRHDSRTAETLLPVLQAGKGVSAFLTGAYACLAGHGAGVELFLEERESASAAIVVVAAEVGAAVGRAIG